MFAAVQTAQHYTASFYSLDAGNSRQPLPLSRVHPQRLRFFHDCAV
jgi:hypothetical protein